MLQLAESSLSLLQGPGQHVLHPVQLAVQVPAQPAVHAQKSPQGLPGTSRPPRRTGTS